MKDFNLEGKKGLFFDCDGTLAYTQKAHKEAYRTAFIKFGLEFRDELFDFAAPFGGDYLMNNIFANEKDKIYKNEIIRYKKIFLGACLDEYMVVNHELINLIKEQYGKRKIVIVSNGRYGSIEQIIRKLSIREYMSYLITKEDVVNAKPHPEPYLLALDIFGFDGDDVIVFEDNRIGIESAQKALIKDIVEVKIDVS